MDDKEFEEMLKKGSVVKATPSLAKKRFARYFLLAPWKGKLSAEDKPQYQKAVEIVSSEKLGFWYELLVKINKVIFRK